MPTVKITVPPLSYPRMVATVLLLNAAASSGQWPIDNEPLGTMGCKFFIYKGLWEQVIDTTTPDEAIESACLTVAAANVVLSNRWPRTSDFDGEFMECGESPMPKLIRHTWDFDLITGGKGINEDCDTDNPSVRFASNDSTKTGLKEMQLLLYAVERSFGSQHECFRTNDDECGGSGYMPLENVMRNRFGYAGCRSLAAAKTDARKLVVQDLKKGIPVIALNCDHAFVIDGHYHNPASGKDVFHTCDYVVGEESAGWFTWNYFVKKGLHRVIVGLSPDYILRPNPTVHSIKYLWGEGHMPSTSYTARNGRITIEASDGLALGGIVVRLRAKSLSPQLEGNAVELYTHKGTVKGPVLTIPNTGMFSFYVGSGTELTLTVRNLGSNPRRVKIALHDYLSTL